VKNGAVPNCDKVGVIFNRIQGDTRTREELQAEVALPVFAVVPYDASLAQYDAQGKSLLGLAEGSVAVKALKGALSAIC